MKDVVRDGRGASPTCGVAPETIGSTALNVVGLTEQVLTRPDFLLEISPTRSRMPRCLVKAGSAIACGFANSLTEAGPFRKLFDHGKARGVAEGLKAAVEIVCHLVKLSCATNGRHGNFAYWLSFICRRDRKCAGRTNGRSGSGPAIRVIDGRNDPIS